MFAHEDMLEEAFSLCESKLSAGELLSAEEVRVFHVACRNCILYGLEEVQKNGPQLCARCQSESESGFDIADRLKSRHVWRLKNIFCRSLEEVEQLLESPSLSSKTRAIFHFVQSDVELGIHELSSGIEEDRHLSSSIEDCRLAQYYVTDLPAYDPIRLGIAQHSAMLQFAFMRDLAAAIEIAEEAIEEAEKDILVAESRGLALTGYEGTEPVRLLNEMKMMLEVWKS